MGVGCSLYMYNVVVKPSSADDIHNMFTGDNIINILMPLYRKAKIEAQCKERKNVHSQSRPTIRPQSSSYTHFCAIGYRSDSTRRVVAHECDGRTNR